MNDPGLKLAKVVAVYPDGYSVDVVFYDDGSPASNVQVLTGPVSTRTGFNDLPAPDVPVGGDKWSMQDSKTTDMIAVVGFVRGVPLVVGFLYPQVNQMLFADKNRMVYRHASGVYFTIDGAGNAELSHPSGAFLRFGATPEHEDLTGKDLDGGWSVPVTAPVNIHIEQAGGLASLNIDTSGNVEVLSQGNISAAVQGSAAVTSVGDMTLTAPNIILNGDTLINGSLMQGTGSNGGGATMAGPLNVTDDVVAGGISLIDHTHPADGGGPAA